MYDVNSAKFVEGLFFLSPSVLIVLAYFPRTLFLGEVFYKRPLGLVG